MSSFGLPKLPYEYGALEPYIDSTTMNIHHTKHHATYINNVNGVLSGPNGDAIKGLSLEAIQRNIASLPDAIKTPVRNSGGGHYNHTMFWTLMAGVGSANSSPFGDLKTAIDSEFGSFDEMQKQFNTAAATRFGSGWAWLCVDDSKKLYICSTPNQDNPLMAGIAEKPGTPILGLDVWEHAYYLKYQNRRPEYISAFWNVVNWDKVVENYNAALGGNAAVMDVPLE
uniref:Superoxide dismutase n=1 Tax=Erythrolobus australicus TaxID=1077150 RepID=A0A7S1TNT0_9RHOD|mmetsp:Transcript_4885/g.13107  ORF Transcript_4885/g.13107 Transcript_4885/m.13107 type:complete len:226 (+) Transcript_4885:83-760(+)|eukprot:CAMPEP_0185833364 /NCGR_PEP_ID=MMETSP1353-20130828/2669_1 /TAXON_ID=1077150 /ORGANISM="Erythrolobus australicus, Strain CCMP3124" /LENGTH=225 /DNA_ID=CAMNT_0028531645 /DNA_START=83 /DNA_END=760 /DNA_ORIENTATION=+